MQSRYAGTVTCHFAI